MIKMPLNKLKTVRNLLKETHCLHDDTDIEVIAGSAPPQYTSAEKLGAVMTVGFLWLKENYPQDFVEAVTQRLNPTGGDK